MYDTYGKIHYVQQDKIDEMLEHGWKTSKQEEAKLKINKNHVSYGRKWVHIPNTNIRKLVLQSEIQKYLNLGYVLGLNKN